jgi:hypothetical protein
MKAAIAAIIILFPAVPVLGQQDPEDPGFQDSVIVGPIASYDSSGQYQTLNVPIYVVSDDSIGFYNMPLTCIAPRGGVQFNQRAMYFAPLTTWDEHYDTIMYSQNYVLTIGWADLLVDTATGPWLYTNHQRLHAMTMRLLVAPNTPRQTVTIDTCWDQRNGSIMFALIDGISEITPGFQPGISNPEYALDIGDEPPLATAISLSQNYPNPFNARTTIGYALAKEGPVNLDVYNLAGQRVAILDEGIRPAGNHVALWDAGDMPSGTYFYRLTVNGQSETKRMVLLK